jgi:hypothetical protein
MVVRGFGSAFATMPAMTAAFASLDHDQVSDASPQLNVIQRVGGSLGTAVIAVVLQSELTGAAHGRHSRLGPAAVASAFDRTYLWVIGMTVLASVPGFVLWRVERSRPAVSGVSVRQEDTLMEVVA